MGETDIWEAGTDTGKTMVTLGANKKITGRIFCPHFFCILVIKQLRDVLQKLLGIQILVEWTLRNSGIEFFCFHYFLIQCFEL